MSQTSKPMSERDFSQVIKNSSNEVNKTIGVDGFLVGKVGHRIEVTYPDSTTEVYTFKDGTNILYAITLVYTTSSKEFLSSAERTI
jgi:hypothetical protein